MLLAGVMWSLAGHVAVARADFTETFCSGGLPSAPWTLGPLTGTSPWLESNDRCAEGEVIGWDTHQNPQPHGKWSTGIEAPAGELFTHVTMNYTTEGSSTGFLFALFGYGPASIIAESKVSTTGLSGVVDAPLPDTNLVWTRVDCDTSNGCPLTVFSNVIAVGAMNLTIHDTGVPAVASAGGSLAATGTVKGTQTLLFNATDVGSGVQRVTLSLGAAVVATDVSPCQPASLTPCPGAVNGTLTADTSLVPDGTYPVILTAYDVSGDPTPIQVATVTVANHTGSVSVPIVHRSKRHGHRLAPLKVSAKFKWDWRGATTRLDFARFGRLPKGGHIVLRCRGKRCPFKLLKTGRAGVGHLQHKLAKRAFRPGQKLDVTISAPHRTAERGTIVIQAGALPVVKAAKGHTHHAKKRRG
jgi:hypothetical protein